ncbi:hypothetical protein HII13_000619 [Brettanomyces bruxellensis]|nr:hypothetical protein HII13_000619 [Brettanomyces bruxellensis]
MSEIVQHRNVATQNIEKQEVLPSSCIVAAETPKAVTKTVQGGTKRQETVAEGKTEPSTIRRFIFKAWMTWSRIMDRLRFISDVCLDSDEITEELFDDGDGSTRLGVKADSSRGNVAPNGDRGNCKTCKCPENKCRCGPAVSKRYQQLGHVKSATLEKDSSILDSSLNEVSTKRAKEAHENSIDSSLTPFTGGEDLWNAQNREWLRPSPEYSDIQGKVKLMKRMREHELRSHVMKRDYPIVYQNLVLQGRALKQPMNLKDLIKVLTTDWAYESYLNKHSALANQRTR